MGVLDKFKDLIGIEEIDDEMLEEELEPQQAPAERRKAGFSRSRIDIF